MNDSSYFAQRYALWFSRKGVFMGGRAGRYNLALGGEWWGLNSDNEIDGVPNDVSVNNAKLLYRGELVFAPGGLPLQFNMYGRDIYASRFVRDRFYTQGTFDQLFLSRPARSVLTPEVINDVENGTHQEYGASLTVGTTNGSYLGQYRNILSHLPKLFVDYRELRVKNLISVIPQQYIDRELAFVSLNKKHNWFHYRFFEHLDKLDPINNSNETTFLLGNIDQHLRRDWINLTNWIRLSTDGRYTSLLNAFSRLGAQQIYELNLFAITDRQNWRSSMFSNFMRYERSGMLEKSLFVPFYASGEPDRNNSWRFQILGSRRLLNVPFSVVNTETAKDDVYTTLRWETGRSTKNVSAPVLELEGKFGDWGQGAAARAIFEYYSNKNIGKANPYDLFSSLTASYFLGTSTQSVTQDVDLFEVSGRIDLAKQLNSRFRTGFGSFLMLGVGKAETGVTEYIRPISLQKLKGSLNRPRIAIDGTVWRIEGLWFMQHIGVSRISNRLETGIEYQDTQDGGAGQYYLTHRLRYAGRSIGVDVGTRVLYGDNIYATLTSRVSNIAAIQSEYDGGSVSNTSNVSYQPNRENRFRAGMGLDWRLPEEGNDGYRVLLNQEYTYTNFLKRGVLRKFLEFNELLDYERLDPDGSQLYEAFALTGLVSYYPSSWSRLSCKVKWQNNIQSGSSDTGFGLYSALNFSLLSVGLEYEYGMRTADSTGAILDRDEQRWSMSIRKVF